MKKTVIWIIVIIIAAILVLRIGEKFKNAKEKPGESFAPTEVVETEVSTGSIARTLSYIGNIVGSEQTNIYPVEETGKLIKYMVKEGDMVSKGDTIALIDRSIKGLDFKPAVINSPISGVAGNLILDPGTMVAPGIPVAMVANINTVKVEINIPEKDISKVKVGNKAIIRVSSYPDEVFNGQLIKVSPVLNPMSRASQASVSISNSGRKLRPGMFANIELAMEEHNNVLLVPVQAVTETGGKKFVFTANGEKAEMKEVTTGIENNDFIEITSGLKPGDKVITLGNYGLEDGTKIVIKSKELKAESEKLN